MYLLKNLFFNLPKDITRLLIAFGFASLVAICFSAAYTAVIFHNSWPWEDSNFLLTKIIDGYLHFMGLSITSMSFAFHFNVWNVLALVGLSFCYFWAHVKESFALVK